MMNQSSTLAELLEHRRLTIDEVIHWARTLAMHLSTLHRHGESHGAVTPANVRIDGNRASLLLPADSSVSSSQAQDISDFASLLRTMLDRTDAETPAARAQWTALHRIALTNSQASPDSRIQRVSSALRLMSPARREQRIELPSPQIAPVRRAPRVVMLVREVPPAPQVTPNRVKATTPHVYAFLGSAAAMAVAGCLLVLKLIG